METKEIDKNQLLEENEIKKNNSNKKSISNNIKPKEIKKETEEVEVLEEIKEETELNIEKEEVQEIINEDSVEKKEKIIVSNLFLYLIIITFLLFVFLFPYFFYKNKSNIILNNTFINDIEISKLTKDEAYKILVLETDKKINKKYYLNYNNQKYDFYLKDVKGNYIIEEKLNEAYKKGKNNNFIQDYKEIIYSIIFGNKFYMNFEYNLETLYEYTQNIEKQLENGVKDFYYKIENDKLFIYPGKAGYAVNKEFLNFIIQNEKILNINLELDYKDAEKIDINQIYNEVKKEPENAYFISKENKLVEHKDGIDFDITLEAANELLKEVKEYYEIPLKNIPAKITVYDLGKEVFSHLVSEFTTKYNAGEINRTNNLILAARKINGTILMPGEIFSYNKVVGKRTYAAGYRDAAMFQGGKVVDGLGGGICQISSTLYNAAIYANLEIIERKNHQFIPSYVTASRDATVVYGAIDFKFKNTRNTPILILASVSNGISSMKLYGLKEETEYDVEIQSYITSRIPTTTSYIDDSSLQTGTEQVIEKGGVGYKSVAYKIVKLNGETISKTLLSNDKYSPKKRIVKRGTMVVQNNQTEQNVQENPISTVVTVE